MIPHENDFDLFFQKYGQEHNIDWLYLKAQVKQESRFNSKAENKLSHAKGLAQFMDSTWLEWEDETPGIQDKHRDHDPFNPEDSIRVQAAYMAYLKDRVKKNTAEDWMSWTLACYNWGMGYILGMKNRTGLIKTPLALAIPQMPKETQGYIKNILQFYNEYKSQTLA